MVLLVFPHGVYYNYFIMMYWPCPLFLISVYSTVTMVVCKSVPSCMCYWRYPAIISSRHSLPVPENECLSYKTCDEYSKIERIMCIVAVEHTYEINQIIWSFNVTRFTGTLTSRLDLWAMSMLWRTPNRSCLLIRSKHVTFVMIQL